MELKKKMKIKSVRYERLFNVGDYQNETIGFIADVDEKENPNTAIAKLYDMVTKINRAMNELRRIAGRLQTLENEEYYCGSLFYTEREIERTKRQLEDAIKESPDAKKDTPEWRHIKRLKEELDEHRREFKRKEKEAKELTNKYQTMIKNFKKGINNEG